MAQLPCRFRLLIWEIRVDISVRRAKPAPSATLKLEALGLDALGGVGDGTFQDGAAAAAVPAPPTLLLGLAGLGVAGAARRRRRA
jgi:MYXO-CTERM domain-containing protein